MSETGPIRVRSPIRARISSCVAANGIICSRQVPKATVEPFGTNRRIASASGRTLSAAGKWPSAPERSGGRHGYRSSMRTMGCWVMRAFGSNLLRRRFLDQGFRDEKHHQRDDHKVEERSREVAHGEFDVPHLEDR